MKNELKDKSENELKEMYIEAAKSSVPPNVLDANGVPHSGAIIDSIEECNFRLAAFARAYMGNNHNVASVIERARILEKHLSDFAVLLMLYANHHENKPLNNE